MGSALSPVAEALVNAEVDSAAHGSTHYAGAPDKRENESSHFLQLRLFLHFDDLLERTQ